MPHLKGCVPMAALQRKGKEAESLGLQEGSQWISWSWCELHTWSGSLGGKAGEASARYPSGKLSAFKG